MSPLTAFIIGVFSGTFVGLCLGALLAVARDPEDRR